MKRFIELAMVLCLTSLLAACSSFTQGIEDGYSDAMSEEAPPTSSISDSSEASSIVYSSHSSSASAPMELKEVKESAESANNPSDASEMELVKYETITFEYNSQYELSESNGILTITFEPQKAVVNILSVESMASIMEAEQNDDRYLEVQHSAWLSELEKREQKDTDYTISGEPAKNTTCLAKLGDSWFVYSLVSFNSGDINIAFQYASNVSEGKYGEDWIAILESIKKI